MAGHFLRSIAAGAAAGAGVFGLSLLLANLTLEYPVSPEWRFLLPHVLAGAVAGVLFLAPVSVFRRGVRLASPAEAVGAVLAVLYSAVVAERVLRVSQLGGASTAVSVAAAVGSVVAAGVWVGALRWLGGREMRRLAPLAGAVTIALLLALNRDSDLTGLTARWALAADVMVLGGAVLCVLLPRAGKRIPGALVALAVVALAVISATRGSRDSAGEVPPSQGAAGPDLVLVVVDALRADVFESVARDTREGGVFRRALGGAAWFTQAIANAPWTPPAMGSIMTGLYPSQHGLNALPGVPINIAVGRLATAVPTLAEQLQRRGYGTEAIVANGYLHPWTGIARGFQRYELLAPAESVFPLLPVLGRLRFVVPESPYRSAAAIRRRLAARLEVLAAADRPFFLWLHLMEPHQPLQPHPELQPEPTRRKSPRLDTLYRNAVRYALAEIARMIGLLKDHQRWANTVFAVTSDHGEMLPSDGAHGLHRDYGHGHALYDFLLRIPLVIRPAGGLPSERRLDPLVDETDLYATLAELTGVVVKPARLGAHSVAAWLAGVPPTAYVRSRSAVPAGWISSGIEQKALRTKRFKIVEYPNGERPTELYDLTADPVEKHDLAADQPDRRARMTARLESMWPPETGAPAPAARDFDLTTRERLRALGYGADP